MELMTLAEEVAKRTTRGRAVERDPARLPLPCEGEIACQDAAPILAADVLELTVKNELGEALPRFSLYDPISADGETEYDPENGALRRALSFHFVLRRIGRRATWVSLLRGELGFVLQVVLVAFTLACVIVTLSPKVAQPPSFLPIGFALAFLTMAEIARRARKRPDYYVSQFAGPIPGEIRALVRSLVAAKRTPLVLAEATWRKPSAEERRVRYMADPFIVTPCTRGPIHFHLHASWDVSKGEVLVEEFAMPQRQEQP